MTGPVRQLPDVVLVNGLPGSGKSTISRALARRFDRAAVLEGDHLQHGMTVSGLVGPGQEPVDEAWRQLDLRWRNLAALTRNFLDEDFIVVVDSLLIPRLGAVFVGTLGAAELAYIHLEPSRSVGLARDAARGYKRIGDAYDYIAGEFEVFRGHGAWLDSSVQTVEETVDDAELAIRTGRASIASSLLA